MNLSNLRRQKVKNILGREDRQLRNTSDETQYTNAIPNHSQGGWMHVRKKGMGNRDVMNLRKNGDRKWKRW